MDTLPKDFQKPIIIDQEHSLHKTNSDYILGHMQICYWRLQKKRPIQVMMNKCNILISNQPEFDQCISLFI